MTKGNALLIPLVVPEPIRRPSSSTLFIKSTIKLGSGESEEGDIPGSAMSVAIITLAITDFTAEERPGILRRRCRTED